MKPPTLERRSTPARSADDLQETSTVTSTRQRRWQIAQFIAFCTEPETAWEMIEGNSELSDKWRFSEFEDAQKFYQYGWDGHVGNYAIRTDTSVLRFKRIGNSNQLQLIFPYDNIPATEGIKEDINPDFLDAEFQLS